MTDAPSPLSTGIPELRRCPFCGGEAERYDCHDTGSVNEGGSCIQCKACQASSPIHFDRKENLYSSWNDRTEPSNVATDLDDPRLYHYGADPELRSAAPAQRQPDPVRKALEAAYRELKAHDADYHYRTPISVNNMIVDALAPQPLDPAYASPIPRADADETKNGWRLDFKWLDNMSRQIEKKTGFSVTQECVEEAVLRTEALLIPSTGGGPAT